MTTEIVKDAGVFMIMLLICFGAVANAFMIMDTDSANESLIDSKFGILALDALLGSYLLGLGEFYMDTMTGRPLALYFFVLATFISQICFMNMLIAIMGDTYERVSNVKKPMATKEKVSMILESHWVVDLDKVFKNDSYVYVVRRRGQAF
jgi:hypothetical protein